MRKGLTYEFEIETTEFPATGIAHVDGLKCYIKSAAPGQKVRARVTKKKKEYAQAKLVEVVEKAPYEIELQCPHFNFCGGCTHQFMPYELQLKNKEREVLQLFEQNELKDYIYEGISSSPEIFEYRNKMEFTFGDMEKDGEITLGMHMPNKGFSVTTVDKCMLIDEDIRKVLVATLEYFKELKVPKYKVMNHEGYLRNLVVRKSKNKQQILINLVTTSQMELDLKDYVDKLLALDYKGKVNGILHTTNDNLADAVIPEKVDILYGTDYIEEEILGLNFKISAFSFFQTNSKGAEKLYSIVREFMGDADNKTVFDLYCGTGTIGQIAAAKAKKVVGIELIAEAVESAKENAKLNGIDNCEFIAGDVAKVIQQVNDKPDIIILDPPRTGVHPTAMDYVIKFQADEIIYVSCNPKTLMNDLKVLETRGYKIERVRIMDMFPMTGHVETVVKLQRKTM